MHAMINDRVATRSGEIQAKTSRAPHSFINYDRREAAQMEIGGGI